MTKVLDAIGLFITRFLPQANQKQNASVTGGSDGEIWIVVTEGGRYPEVWETYRTKGLLEAIKERDEKANFDRRLDQIKMPHSQKQADNIVSAKDVNFNSGIKPVLTTTIKTDNNNRLDELDLAAVKGLASYFQDMIGKILHYYRDHHASKEEAKLIAKYYQEAIDRIERVQTKSDLQELVRFLENLKSKVSRYEHNNYKYRWSTGLEKVLFKLKKI